MFHGITKSCDSWFSVLQAFSSEGPRCFFWGFRPVVWVQSAFAVFTLSQMNKLMFSLDSLTWRNSKLFYLNFTGPQILDWNPNQHLWDEHGSSRTTVSDSTSDAPLVKLEEICEARIQTLLVWCFRIRCLTNTYGCHKCNVFCLFFSKGYSCTSQFFYCVFFS